MTSNAPDVITGVEGELRSYGISIERIAYVDPESDEEDDPADEDTPTEQLEVAYITAFPGTDINHKEMGRACNALIELAEEGTWTPQPVTATVLRADDDQLGTWRIDPAWIEGLLAYDLSETEFSARVVDSIEGADE